MKRELYRLIAAAKVSQKDDCMQCVERCPILHGFSWRRVKHVAYSQVQAVRRRRH